MKKFLLIFTLFATLVKSQIGINTDSPNVLSVLDIRTTVNDTGVIPKGILIPRLTKEQIKQIDVANPELANSLMVYNTDENCINIFNKVANSWRSICGEAGSADFTIDCTQTKIYGTYYKGVALSSKNYAEVTLNVTSAGTYNITALSDNGYSFNKSGEFLTPGSYTVTLEGMGTPLLEGTNTLVVKNSDVDTSCTLSIAVIPEDALYTLDCSTYTVNGMYALGKALNKTNSIDISVNVTRVGGWEMNSSTVDGISFSGNGQFTQTGVQKITLYGSGSPTTSKNKQLTIFTVVKGDVSSSFCNVVIQMPLRAMRINGIGSSVDNFLVKDSNGYTVTYDFLSSANNFGIAANSIVKIYPFTFGTATKSVTRATVADTPVTDAELKKILEPADGTLPPDIFIMAQPATLKDEAAANVILNYLQKGGAAIIGSAASNILVAGNGNMALLKKILGDGVTADRDGYNSLQTTKIPNVDHPYFNGPFGDIRGLDLGSSFTFSNSVWSAKAVGNILYLDALASSKVEWSILAPGGGGTTGTGIYAFKPIGYNLLYITDANAFNYSNGTAVTSFYPTSIQALSNKAMSAKYSKTGVETYNSILFGNVIAAMAAEVNEKGINK